MSCADHSLFWCPLQPGPGSLSLPRWGAGWSPAPSAAPSASSAWPAATPGPTSPGSRTTSPSLPRRLGRTRRRSGRWTWRTWSQRTAGSTPAGCSTELGKSTRRTKSKWSVSAALGGRAQRGLEKGLGQSRQCGGKGAVLMAGQGNGEVLKTSEKTLLKF